MASDRSRRRVAALRGVLRQPLVLSACAVVALALLERVGAPARGVLVVAAPSVLWLPLPAGALLVLICSQHQVLMVDPSVGRLSVVDVLLLLLLARVVLRQRLHLVHDLHDWPAGFAVAFIVIGGVATALAASGSAVTAFLRVATYVTVAIALTSALERQHRTILLRGFVGITLAQVVLAVVGFTARIPTGFPIGRYVGTIGDPAQFGIPVAAALAALLVDRRVIQGPWLRWAAATALAIGLIGSNTRAALVAFVLGFGASTAHALYRRGTPAAARFALGVVTGVALAGLSAVLTVFADQVGLMTVSTRVRIDSVTASLEYLRDHPLRPTGLGNLPGEFPAYNTWIALGVALSPLAALLFAALATTVVVRVARAAEPAWMAIGLCLLATTLTENVVFAGSSLTLVWCIAIGAMARPSGPSASHVPAHAPWRALRSTPHAT